MKKKTKIGLRNRKIVIKVFLTVFVVSAVIGIFYPFFTEVLILENPKVIDGDTIELKKGEETKTVRLNGVDTPETEGYNTPEEFKNVPKGNWKCLQNWGYAAKNYVEGKLESHKAMLEYQKGILSVNRGFYGRILGKIYLNGSNESLGRKMVEEGYARSYGEMYIEEERKARNNSKGLWECTR